MEIRFFAKRGYIATGQSFLHGISHERSTHFRHVKSVITATKSLVHVENKLFLCPLENYRQCETIRAKYLDNTADHLNWSHGLQFMAVSYIVCKIHATFVTLIWVSVLHRMCEITPMHVVEMSGLAISASITVAVRLIC